MAWLSEADFRAVYITESATETTSPQIGDCLNEAVDQIESLCGADYVAEVVAYDEVVSPTALQTRRHKTFRRAQGKLAYRALLLIQSSRFRDGGIVDTEKDSNADTTNKYVSFTETETRRDALMDEVLMLLKPYLTVETVNTSVGRVSGNYGAVRVVSD